MQAKLLNKAHTDINIIVGLCVGDDIIFTSEFHAPVTTLIVKDRYTGHNPAVSLYVDYYYKGLL